jgi:hypothetical protein
MENKMYKEGSFMIFEHKGLKCVIARMPQGFLNGYVAVPKNHPLWGKDYNDDNVLMLEVHGGITYADKYLKGYELPDKDDLWWFGFDTAHFEDFKNPKDMEYVKKETIKLAEQLIRLMDNKK